MIGIKWIKNLGQVMVLRADSTVEIISCDEVASLVTQMHKSGLANSATELKMQFAQRLANPSISTFKSLTDEKLKLTGMDKESAIISFEIMSISFNDKADSQHHDAQTLYTIRLALVRSTDVQFHDI